MPETINGEGYREFSEPRFFEIATLADIAKIRNPVDKAHAIFATADGNALDVWKFAQGSATTADAYNVITPANTGVSGRWKRTGTVVNVLTFGADPTGVTDSSTAVASAVTALGTKGGTVFFPRGIYRFNVTVIADNIRFLGDSFSNNVHAGDTNESYFAPFSAASACITVGGSGWTHGFSIENCTFNGNDVTGLTAVRFKGGAFSCFLRQVAFFKFLKCLHFEAEAGQNDCHHIFIDNWQMQVGTEAGARGIYAKMANNQSPVTLSIFFSNGQMNGPTGASSYGVEVDGTFLDFVNCYCDLTVSKGVKISQTGTGQLSPYIHGYASYFDSPGGGELVTVGNFTTVPLWESYMRGSLGIVGSLVMSNGVTVSGYWKQMQETSTAFSLQITGELALMDYTTRSGVGNTYSNTKRVYASGSTLILENTAGNVTLAPTGALNLAPAGASGTVAVNGGTLGMTIAAGATGLVNITGGSLVIDNNKGVIIKDTAGNGETVLAVSSVTSDTIIASPTSGGKVQLYNRNAAGKIEFFPGTGSTLVAQVDSAASATDTGLLLLNNGTVKRVVTGANDSGGAGFRMLRVAN